MTKKIQVDWDEVMMHADLGYPIKKTAQVMGISAKTLFRRLHENGFFDEYEDRKRAQRSIMRRPNYHGTKVIIQDTARTFRVGAPITVIDIRVAAKADGNDLSGVSSNMISACLSEICNVEYGPYGLHDRKSWILLPGK